MATFFISPAHRNNSKLALFTFILAFVVIMLGAYTRLTDAGLSCPDWPHCYGYLTAPHTESQLQGATQLYPHAPVDIKKAWTEMTHRYFAGTEGILILFLAGALLFFRKPRSVKSISIAIVLLGLLVVQVMLGMLTVTKNLKPVIVLSHLLTGISILSVLWWAYLDVHLTNPAFFQQYRRPRVMPWLWIGFLIVAMQITLGGWVSTHYAGLACVDFPYCNGQVLPQILWGNLNTDLISIHMLHRIGALVTAVYIGLLSLFLMRYQALRGAALFLFGVLTLQITLGILNIIWLRPVWIALIHQSVAILLLLSVITLLVKTSYLSKQS